MPKIKFDIEKCRKILIDYFRTISFAGEEELNEMVALFHLDVYPKRAIIIHPNSPTKRLYFVINGLVRSYYTIEGKEITSNFIEENRLFASTYSIITGIPNIDCFEALENTVCLSADFKELEHLFSKYHLLERLARKMVEMYYSQFLIENYNKLFLTSEERFEICMAERASLVNRVSLKHIASYLSIAPETLSILRAKR